jgi:hypothetical protein
MGERVAHLERVAEAYQHQDMVFDEKHWEQMLDFSEHQLQDAYSRMDMDVQGWTKYTPHEIDFVERVCGLNDIGFVLGLAQYETGCCTDDKL